MKRRRNALSSICIVISKLNNTISKHSTNQPTIPLNPKQEQQNGIPRKGEEW